MKKNQVEHICSYYIPAESFPFLSIGSLEINDSSEMTDTTAHYLQQIKAAYVEACLPDLIFFVTSSYCYNKKNNDLSRRKGLYTVNKVLYASNRQKNKKSAVVYKIGRSIIAP